MNKYSQKATELFKQGYNCAQAVFCAFDTDLDKETALRLASSFGGGMGRMREVCGAVSAMFMIAGIKQGYTEPNNDTIKGEHYTRIQQLAQEFKKQHNSIICRELLGINDNCPTPTKRNDEFYQTRPCEKFIATAAELVSKYFD